MSEERERTNPNISCEKTFERSWATPVSSGQRGKFEQQLSKAVELMTHLQNATNYYWARLGSFTELSE